MQLEFIVKSVLILEQPEPGDKPKYVGIKFNLDVSDALDLDAYLDDRGLPNEAGTRAITNVLVQGLIGNIHQGHHNNFWNDAEHLRFIINELEQGFIRNAEVGESTF